MSEDSFSSVYLSDILVRSEKDEDGAGIRLQVEVHDPNLADGSGDAGNLGGNASAEEKPVAVEQEELGSEEAAAAGHMEHPPETAGSEPRDSDADDIPWEEQMEEIERQIAAIDAEDGNEKASAHAEGPAAASGHKTTETTDLKESLQSNPLSPEVASAASGGAQMVTMNDAPSPTREDREDRCDEVHATYAALPLAAGEGLISHMLQAMEEIPKGTSGLDACRRYMTSKQHITMLDLLVVQHILNGGILMRQMNDTDEEYHIDLGEGGHQPI